MARKGNRLREFEKNHRVLDISSAQEERQRKRLETMQAGGGYSLTGDGDADSAYSYRDAAGNRDVAGSAFGAEVPSGKGEKSGKSGKGNRNVKHRLNRVRLIGLCLVVLFVAVIASSVKNIYDLKAREQTLLDRKEELEQLKEELALTLENVNGDTYIEAQARRELKLVKGNELVFFFPDTLKKADSEDKQAAGEEPEEQESGDSDAKE